MAALLAVAQAKPEKARRDSPTDCTSTTTVTAEPLTIFLERKHTHRRERS